MFNLNEHLPGLAQPEPNDVTPAKCHLVSILHCNGPPESPFE